MSVRSIASALLFFALGAAAMAWMSRPQTPNCPAPEAISPALREKFQHLTEQDLEEYYRLKGAEEKFSKADEILGKIMAIFLADLGLHASDHALASSKEKFVPEARVSESRAVKIPSPAPTALPPEDPPPRMIGAENHLLNVRSESEIAPALSRVKLANFSEVIKASSKFSNRSGQLSYLNGNFAGRAQVTLGGHKHDWDTFLELNGAMKQGQLEGRMQIRLSESGKVFSNSSSKGSLPLRDGPGQSNALLVSASPNIYFQLYYVKDLDQLAGNVYRRDSDEQEFNFAGTVTLSRM